MPGLLDSCQEYFGTTNLYDVLGVQATSKPEDVKRAYFKLSLHVHPDKVEQDAREQATKKFQTLGKVYTILTDGDKRAAYDESGDVDEEVENEDRDWEKYWRLLFKKITVKDIDEFKLKYLGSQEEIDDVKKSYVKFEGDMDMIVQCVPFADVEAEPRLRDMIERLIESEEVAEYEAFVNEDDAKRNKRKRKAQREASAAKKASSKDLGGDEGGVESLAAAIALNAGRHEKQMDSLIASLEARYGGGAKKSKGARSKTTKTESSPQTKRSSRSKK